MVSINCPVCFREIDHDRIVGANAYCNCGHTIHLKNTSKRDNRGSLPLIIFTAFLVGAIIHAINWDTYFFSIIPLKMKQMIGIAQAQDLKTIAEICQKRKKSNCEIQALEMAYQIDKKEIAGLIRVSHLYFEQKNFLSTSQTLTKYYKHGGKDEESRYIYARSLGETGHVKDAKNQFHYILRTNRSNPQFQVARAYVELLIRNNDYVTAKGVIEEYRRAGPSAALFLDKEWKQINDKLKASSKTSYKSAST